MAGTASGNRDGSVQDKQGSCLQGAFIIEWDADTKHVINKYILHFQTFGSNVDKIKESM